MKSIDGLNWTSVSNVPTNDWSSITYGEGMFVAVASGGSGGRVMTSSDGVTWTSRTHAAANTWNDIAYGNDVFVAVSSAVVAGTNSNNKIMTSADGINWTIRNSVDAGWYGICFGAGVFVVVASSVSGNGVMTSPDGINWTVQSIGGLTSNWNEVAYGDGMFVSVGSPSRSGDPAVMTSGSIVLPVRWLSFTGKPITKAIQLNWSVASEENNHRYEVERSIDAINFQKVGTVLATSNSNHKEDYTFVDDADLNAVKIFYRLRQVGVDGAQSYSSIVSVSGATDIKRNLVKFLSDRALQIEIPISLEGYTDINILDLTNRVIVAKRLSAGKHTILTSTMKAGVYVVVLRNHDQVVYTERFIQH